MWLIWIQSRLSTLKPHCQNVKCGLYVVYVDLLIFDDVA